MIIMLSELYKYEMNEEILKIISVTAMDSTFIIY